MAHKYEIHAGNLLEIDARGFVGLSLSFFVWDLKTKTAAYSLYSSTWSAEDQKRHDQAFLNNTAVVRKIGMGRSSVKKTITLSERLDMKLLDNRSPATLSIVKDSESSSEMTATVTLDCGCHVNLPFPILATISSGVPLTTRGTIRGSIHKNVRKPKLPREMTEDPRHLEDDK
jgi:hypothetical protein